MGACAGALCGYCMFRVSVAVYVRGCTVCVIDDHCYCVWVCVGVECMFTICAMLACRRICVV